MPAEAELRRAGTGGRGGTEEHTYTQAKQTIIHTSKTRESTISNKKRENIGKYEVNIFKSDINDPLLLGSGKIVRAGVPPGL